MIKKTGSIQTSCIKRLQKEIKNLKMNPSSNYSAGPIDSKDLTVWQATIFGPIDSPFEGGTFKFKIKFPNKYPHEPPKITVDTKIYHPNFSGDRICMSTLDRDGWSSALEVSELLLSICSLLDAPNPNSPLNSDAADLYCHNKKEYVKKVRLWVRKYAT